MESNTNYDSTSDTLIHIRNVQGKLNAVARELMIRGEKHDSSKLLSPEKEIFDEYTPKLKNSTYGSDEYKEFLSGMGEALKHHYDNNRHHPEYYRLKCDHCNEHFSIDSSLHSIINNVVFYQCPRCTKSISFTESNNDKLTEDIDNGINGMTLIDLIEMFCDWKAASERHTDGNIFKSIEINSKRFNINDQLKNILIKTANELYNI